MNSPWVKVLVFSLLFGVLGFVLGRMCGSCGRGGCGHGDEAAMHGGAECHGGKAACCKGGHHDGAGHGAKTADTISVMNVTTGDTVQVVTPAGH